jgi:hypothetical protein
MRGPDGARVAVASALLPSISAAEGAPAIARRENAAATPPCGRSLLRDMPQPDAEDSRWKSAALDAIDVASPGRAPGLGEGRPQLRTGAMLQPVAAVRSEVDAFSSWLEAELDSGWSTTQSARPGRPSAESDRCPECGPPPAGARCLPRAGHRDAAPDNTVGPTPRRNFVRHPDAHGRCDGRAKISRLAVGDPAPGNR